MEHDGNGWTTCAQGHRHWGRFGAAGLLLRDGGRVLLQHRSAQVAHPGTWSVPGGARDSHESALQAALREAEEETGVLAGDVEVGAQHLDDHGHWSYVTVLGQPVRPVRLLGNWEVAELRWVVVDSVDGLDLHPHFAMSWPAVRRLLV